MSKRFANTGRLMRFALRTDRVKLPVWVISLVLFTILFGQMIPGLYTTGIDRQIMAETMKNPAITVMLGPGYGLDNYTDGAMMAHFMLLFSAIAFAMMGILLTANHTREDEEEGRLEMIRSLPTGALSPLTSTVLVGVIANVFMTLLIGFGLAALGFETMDLHGSFLYGASLGSIGIFFTALTGLFAQLTSNARATTGYSFAFLIITYILRGIGDVSSEALSLITPFGLILRTQVYVNNHWWPVWVTLIVSAFIFALSLYLNSIRDLGAGFISTKPGKTHASNFLCSPMGLALRLQRTSIIAWIVGMLVLGSSYGSVLGDLEGFIKSSDLIKQMIPDTGQGLNMTERFISLLMSILSILGSVPVLMFVLKLRSEEKKNRTEHLLTKAVSRNSLLGSYMAIALIAAPIVQLASISGLWSSAIMVMEDPVSFQTLITGGMVFLPAMWCMVGLAVLLIGVAPKRTGLTWLYLGYTFFVVYLGDMLKLPDWTRKFTPFGYIPQIPADEINLLTLTLLTFLAFGLMVVGFIGYNKQDMEG